jgi:hypothetical protein
MRASRTSETSIDNYFTRQYIPEDNSEHRPDDGCSTYLWNVGRQSFYMAVHPRRQFWTSYFTVVYSGTSSLRFPASAIFNIIPSGLSIYIMWLASLDTHSHNKAREALEITTTATGSLSQHHIFGSCPSVWTVNSRDEQTTARGPSTARWEAQCGPRKVSKMLKKMRFRKTFENHVHVCFLIFVRTSFFQHEASKKQC